MITVAMSTIRIPVTILTAVEIVDTSLAALLPDGESVVVVDDNLVSPVCFVVSSINPVLTVAESKVYAESATSTHLTFHCLL